MRWLPAAALLAACGGECLTEDPKDVHALHAEPGEGLGSFVAHPFPSNALRRIRGGIDLRHLPNPTQSSTLDDYVEIISNETNGFGTSAPLFLGFSGPIDEATLPRTLVPSEADSVALIDVDPASPELGRRYPLQLRRFPDGTLYLPVHSLAMLVPYGIPLRSGTTYALVVTDALESDGAPVVASKVFHNGLRAACREEGRAASALAPLRDFIAAGSLELERIAGGAVFTTQETLGELRALASEARKEPAPSVEDLRANGYSDGFLAFTGEIDLAAYQEGRLPYRAIEDGGALAKDDAGRFIVTHRERTRISVLLPRIGEMPENGWPVVLYAHGTGGDFDSAKSEGVGDTLGRRGIAVVGYDQTLHGPRDPTESDPRITFFNLFNPVAARDNIRQGAADATILTTLIESLVVPEALTSRRDERFDPARIAFLGHSQGALTGALFAAVDERPKAIVFSGLGAILSITLQERKDIVDFAMLLRTLLALPDDEVLDDFHPVLGLIETFIEPADPIAYAKSYLSDPPMGSDRDMLVVEGFLDFASPARGQEAFATAAGFPVVAPVHRVPMAAELVGPTPQEAPAKENVDARSGRVTAGLIQYPEDTHFPIFDNADANRRYADFLRSALYDGRAVIDP
jgi:predicted esterase